MHGGALVSLADSAVVITIKSVMAPETHVATISMECHYHHPVKQGTLVARAAVVEREGSILKGACNILDDADRTVKTFASVFKIANDAAIRGITFANTAPDGEDR
jgi:uncharacterized protein (TIGR00369 family)